MPSPPSIPRAERFRCHHLPLMKPFAPQSSLGWPAPQLTCQRHQGRPSYPRRAYARGYRCLHEGRKVPSGCESGQLSVPTLRTDLHKGLTSFKLPRMEFRQGKALSPDTISPKRTSRRPTLTSIRSLPRMGCSLGRVRHRVNNLEFDCSGRAEYVVGETDI
jgi:hypothetical protein